MIQELGKPDPDLPSSSVSPSGVASLFFSLLCAFGVECLGLLLGALTGFLVKGNTHGLYKFSKELWLI